MNRILLLGILFGFGFTSGCLSDEVPIPQSNARASEPAQVNRARSFRFHYRFTVSDLAPGKQVRIWMPVPESNEHQEVTALPYDLPAKPSFHHDPFYENRILYLETQVPENGQLNLNVSYAVTRREVLALKSDGEVPSKQQIDELDLRRFLKPNSKVPVVGKPLDLLSGVNLSEDKFQLANQLYNVVDDHVAYNKEGGGWGNGDVLWVCDSRRGNCTDFHSLFISLARSQGIPSRFEIGFSIPNDAKQGSIGGYHCWAFFHDQSHGWVPVDISEADKNPSLKEYYFGSLSPDRVSFSVGRDIELVPRSAHPSLNYFIYPHVELDGQPVSRDRLELKFSYEDI